MIVYKITNKINGKCYIGQTRQKLSDRWIHHCSVSSGCLAIKSAIDKYGKNNFTIEQIYKAYSISDLNKKEAKFINKFNTLAPNGYNLKTGGNSPRYSEESRKKMSDVHKGNPGYWVGKSHSEDTKQKISKAKSGKNNHNFGKSPSINTRLKMSLSQSNKKSIVCNETRVQYRSLGVASRELDLCEQNIRSVLKGRRKSTGGLTFSYYGA
jgi:group I intron endonuclease